MDTNFTGIGIQGAIALNTANFNCGFGFKSEGYEYENGSLWRWI